MLFLAEWGDLSQLLTASMVLQFKEPVSVFIGAFLALATVSALAAVIGRALLARVKLATIRRIGGGVCLRPGRPDRPADLRGHLDLTYPRADSKAGPRRAVLWS